MKEVILQMSFSIYPRSLWFFEYSTPIVPRRERNLGVVLMFLRVTRRCGRLFFGVCEKNQQPQQREEKNRTIHSRERTLKGRALRSLRRTSCLLACHS